MKPIAITLTCITIAAWLIVLSFRTPLNGNRDFSWLLPFGVGQVSVGVYGIATSFGAADGTNSWQFYVWPPRFQHQFMSKELARLVLSDDYSSDINAPYWKEFKRLNAEDERRYWVWPDWMGHYRSP